MKAKGAWQACAGAALAAFFALLSPAAPAKDSAPEAPKAAPAQQSWADIGNHRCLRCHADPEEKVYVRPDGTQVNLMIDTQAFDHSVHGKQQCTG